MIDMSKVHKGTSFTGTNGKPYVMQSDRAKRAPCSGCGHTPLWIAVNPDTSRIVLMEKDGTPHFLRCPAAAERKSRFGAPRVSVPMPDGIVVYDEATATPSELITMSADDVRRMMAEALRDLAPGVIPDVKPVAVPKPVKPARSLRFGSGDSWALVTAAANALPRVLLYGPPGTGKTHLALSAGLIDGQPTYRVNMTEDTPAAELRGHYVPSGDGWHWQDGPAMRAFRSGGRLVIDEVTRAADDALSFLLALLDGHPITLPSGETVERHPELSVWATTNDDPTALTDALADRFTVRVKCDKVNPEALKYLPEHIRSAVSTSPGGVSYREAQEYARLSAEPEIQALTAACGRDIAAQLVWEARARDVAAAFKLSEAPKS